MSMEPTVIEGEIELPGSVAQVRTAVATGPGISSWFPPQDLVPKVDEAGRQVWLSERAAS